MKDYEKIVMEHYSRVAAEDGSSELATMKDKYVREQETLAIIDAIRAYSLDVGKEDLSIIDVGCGNGYTLSEIIKAYPHFTIEGIEKNDSLREIAINRLGDNIKIQKGDITSLSVSESDLLQKDIVICQRVIINLLDIEDQRIAIKNICKLVKNNGILISIECFAEPLQQLNAAREEFGFSPIKPSFHNLYLSRNMLPSEDDGFERYSRDGIRKENFLSSHYYLSRVLHDILLQGRPFKRNSHFLEFFTQAIPTEIGDYSPIKFHVFRKVR